jgi:RimJ/RimL family protein N-acetyltransferase
MPRSILLSTVSPTIRTERLILRAPVAGDFPDYAAFLASERAQHMGGPYDRRGAWGLFCHDVAQWPLFGHGALMIELPDGACAGQVGINHGPLFPEKELGWLIYAGHEGQGYASEAAAALRDWAFGQLGLQTLVSYVDPRNQRSIAVAERLGARLDANADRTDPGDLVYRHQRPAS